MFANWERSLRHLLNKHRIRYFVRLSRQPKDLSLVGLSWKASVDVAERLMGVQLRPSSKKRETLSHRRNAGSGYLTTCLVLWKSPIESVQTSMRQRQCCMIS